VALAAAGLSSIVSLRSIGGDPQKLEQARRIERAMDEDRVRRERLLEGEPPVRPAAPAVRRDTADGDILPASAGDRTER
jgi:hypothetical protein